MIILDTNVLSAVMASGPEAAVVAWLDRAPPDSIWITAVTVFEVRMGLELLVRGRKRARLESAFELALQEDLRGRVLAFDEPAAVAAAQVAARRRRAGRPVDVRDTQIAGIATARGATIATRNTRHFDDLDVDVVNPWLPRA